MTEINRALPASAAMPKPDQAWPRAVVAGMGSIGQRHLRNLRALGVRDIVVQTSRPDAVRRFTDGVVVTEIDEALADHPDVVLVCTPASSHVSIASAAARAGCHLFVEKPLSDSIHGVTELAQLVRRRNLTVLAGFDLRFDPGLCQVKAWVDEGRIGRVLAVQAQVGEYLPDWRPGRNYRDTTSARAEWGGGVIFELSHELDYVSWLLGPVVDVSCLQGRVSNLDIDVEDVAAITLRFQSGAIGSVHLDCLQRVPSRTCRLIGELGTIEWDYHGKHARLQNAKGSAAEVFSYPEFTRDLRFETEMRHLLDCLSGAAMPRADLAAAVSSLKIALAARRSAETGSVCHPE